MTNHTLCTGTRTVGDAYDTHRASDEFLYVTYTPENAFGALGEQRAHVLDGGVRRDCYRLRSKKDNHASAAACLFFGILLFFLLHFPPLHSYVNRQSVCCPHHAFSRPSEHVLLWQTPWLRAGIFRQSFASPQRAPCFPSWHVPSWHTRLSPIAIPRIPLHILAP